MIMLRVRARVRIARRNGTHTVTTVIRPSVYTHYDYEGRQASTSRFYSDKIPPLSQKYRVNAETVSSVSNASPGAGSNSGDGGGKGRITAAVLGFAAIGAVAAGSFMVLDPLGLSVEKKLLVPAPSIQAHKATKSISSPTISVSQSKEHPAETASAEITITEVVSKTAAAAASSSVEKRTSVVTSIAEDSVQFLLNGKRTVEDEAAVAKLERAQKLSETNKLNAKLQQEKKLREEKLAKALSLQQKQDAELESLRKHEEDKRRRNIELEDFLSKEFSWILEHTQKSVTLNSKATDACNEHVEQLKKAMAADVENVAQEYWPKVCDLRSLSLSQSLEAQSVTEATGKRIVAFLDRINIAKKDETTSGHPSLGSLESQAKEIALELQQSAELLHNADSTGNVMKDYYKTLQSQETVLQQGLENNLPQSKPGQKGNKLSEEELNELLVYAHQRVLLLRRQLREQELFEQHRIQVALSKQGEEDELDHKARLHQELEKQEMQCKTEKEAQLKLEGEKEKKTMEEELARKSLALHNHGIEILNLQEKQLTEEYSKVIKDRVEYERSSNVESVAGPLMRVNQLSNHIARQPDTDELLSNLQQLVSSAKNLLCTVTKTDPLNATDYHTVTVKEAVDRCKQASPDNEFVQTILGSISEKALSSGLFTMSSLERRFQQVVNECRQNSFLPESTSLSSSWLSRAYSSMTLFTLKPKFRNVSDFYEEGTHGMDTKELLVQAQYFVDRHCLTEAVRCMLQLKGVPRTLAQDWIDETRLYLEVWQACEAIQSYAMGQAMGQIL